MWASYVTRFDTLSQCTSLTLLMHGNKKGNCRRLRQTFTLICGIITRYVRRADREAEGARLLSE